MCLSSTGKVNTKNILTVTEYLDKSFTPVDLPVCVDFDHVFDRFNPNNYFARSNIENLDENLFYITKTSQAVLNQVEHQEILPGKYFSILPVRSTAIEDKTSYTNNLVVVAFVVSKEDSTATLANVVKDIYALFGLNYKVSVCSDVAKCVEFSINDIVICRVETCIVEDNYITVANIVSEPMFSAACRQV